MIQSKPDQSHIFTVNHLESIIEERKGQIATVVRLLTCLTLASAFPSDGFYLLYEHQYMKLSFSSLFFVIFFSLFLYFRKELKYKF